VSGWWAAFLLYAVLGALLKPSAESISRVDGLPQYLQDLVLPGLASAFVYGIAGYLLGILIITVSRGQAVMAEAAEALRTALAQDSDGGHAHGGAIGVAAGAGGTIKG
jgi:hypothetical protein